MANLLKGKDVSNYITENSKAKVEELKAKGINPCLAILRVGERDDDISYEKGAMKRCAETGVEVKNVILPLDVTEELFFDKIQELNQDKNVHGILMFRPLPKHIDENKARNLIARGKDVDACTDLSLAGVFIGSDLGFAPCTAQAAMEILKYYKCQIKGKKVAVLGRSLVVGRPLAMMLMKENATVTICHTRTEDVPSITRDVDIIIAATGQMESIGRDYVSTGQTIIDVGISWNNEKQKLCGDVIFDEVEPICQNITPVPGGVGAVTTSVLISHVVEAAIRL
ncbi:MAG: bifunctional 5,10-methylenetetrahydrofolate dehydrogenase/5,10-methenyltetrahydrofolate cyclohydrolase [Pseudobutyrivibrio sp.]|nr:bifunctional 5,10-methylenetetrahydrofolate dehydrogenase/5,10-methenyltetrahydrofolate cyclohydrolase [Pseudobutyrivibrio sp.]